MKVLNKKQKDNVVSLKLEANETEIQAGMDKAFQKLVVHAKVPGFRKGKVTRPLFEKHYGRGVLIEEAIQKVVEITYSKAIKDLALKVIDHPRNFNIGKFDDGKPLEFSCDVEVMPDVKLGKYKGLKVKKDPAHVDDASITTQTDQLREKFAEYEPVERESQSGDIIRAHIEALIDGEAYAPWTRQNVGLRLGMNHFGEEFDTNLVSQKKGAKLEFEITYAKDFQPPEVAEKTVKFSVQLEEVREKRLPELTDELVARGSEFKTVTEIQDSLRHRLQTQADSQSKEKLHNDLVNLVIDNSKMNVPNVLIDREVSASQSNFEGSLKQSGSNLDHYLKIVGKSPEDFKTELAKDAERKVKSALVLAAISTKEALGISDDDYETEIASWSDPKYNSLEDLKKDAHVDLGRVGEAILQKKATTFLVAKAKIS